MFQEYKRVLRIARRPKKEEFLKTIKITGIGMLLLGFIGFLIQLLFEVIR